MKAAIANTISTTTSIMISTIGRIGVMMTVIIAIMVMATTTTDNKRQALRRNACQLR
jgi:hypothetical protein